jgi:hypothetical protein
MDETEATEKSRRLLDDGVVVLDGLFSSEEVEEARRSVLSNIHLLRNTRPNRSSGHLAGFHRHPRLRNLHDLLSRNGDVLSVLSEAMGACAIRPIGLSDITVSRSQQWHVDLLRGKYQRHLTPEICWGTEGGGVYKALLYLQRGTALRVLPGAHRNPVPLDADQYAEPKDLAGVTPVEVPSGAVVLMDIRLPHRGQSEDELMTSENPARPKILVSTVLGDDRKLLTAAMESGNSERQRDWDARHGGGPAPLLALSAS